MAVLGYDIGFPPRRNSLTTNAYCVSVGLLVLDVVKDHAPVYSLCSDIEQIPNLDECAICAMLSCTIHSLYPALR